MNESSFVPSLFFVDLFWFTRDSDSVMGTIYLDPPSMKEASFWSLNEKLNCEFVAEILQFGLAILFIFLKI